MRARDGHGGPGQRADHAVLAIDRVRGWQQLARRLAAQHVRLSAGGELVGRVRLAALELLDFERPGETVDVVVR